MKGIILAGGSGTRLYPSTLANSKQLIPIYDKPMVYYPLATLMMAGIKDVLIISTPVDLPRFQSLLRDGSDYGINISYKEQPSPDGLAQAFLIGEDFIGEEACALALGDNIFFGKGFIQRLKDANKDANNGISTIFGYRVPDPKRYGIVEFDDRGNVISIEEKPEQPKSSFCVTGLYFYGPGVSKRAKTIKPSKRGELEITDLNNIYLNEKKLKVQLLDDNYTWWDTGTFDSMLEASNYIQKMSKRYGISVCSPEGIAYKNGWISKEKLENIAEKYKKNSYGEYLKSLLE